MTTRISFVEKLARARRDNDSLVCVGLDPDPALMPIADILEFNRAIVDATADLVCAYKPNLAFYEALGMEGLEALDKTRRHIPPSIPVIGDAKRGDIGNTARAYAKGLFEVFDFDAATVNPYLGRDAVEPFFSYQDRGVFVLCRTSNPGAADFQDLQLSDGQGTEGAAEGGTPLYEIVARRVTEWNTFGNLGLVVGATYPEELRRIRGICPDMPILIPGVGAQGGDLEAAVLNGVDARDSNAIVCSSRQILYASRDRDFAAAARRAAMQLRDAIRRILSSKRDRA